VKLYKDDNQTLMELQNKNLDAVITDRVVGINAINQGEFKIGLLAALCGVKKLPSHFVKRTIH
jgi:polar amino acid transport system substrate-binding protein